MKQFKPSFVLVLLLAFISYGCIPYGVVHRKNTPISKETRIASSPNTIKMRELTVSAQPTVHNPLVPVTFRYSERLIGPEEQVAKYEEREYRHMWSPLFYPGYIFITPWILGFMLSGVEGKPHDEHTKEWGCLYTNKEMLLYGAMAVVPCYSSQKQLYKWRSPVIRHLPDVEERHPTGRTVEEQHPVAQQPVVIKVAAQGVHWQKDTILTVLTDVEGQQSIPLESMFKEFPDVPLEVVIRLTAADAAETSVRLDSAVCAAIYSHIRP
jgi:hypothetical protein